MRTVYVMGAGASKHVGYPLISDVMGAGASKHVGYPLISGMSKQLFEWMAVYPNDMFRSSADFLVERFGTDPNIEDVITAIDSLIRSNMKDRLQHWTLVTARQQLF